MRLQIEKDIWGGQGLARHEGKVVMVQGAMAGETCEAEVISEQSGYSRARALSILEASPDRVPPSCPRFKECGGCAYLDMKREREISVKGLVLRESLARTGSLSMDEIPDIRTITGPREGYRSHAAVASDAESTGFYASGSHNVVPLPSGGCRLLPGELNEYILRCRLPKGQHLFALDGDMIPHGPGGGELLVERERGFTYVRALEDFFQGNRFLRGELIDLICRALPPGRGRAADLGCGIGFFTLPMALHCEHVKGFDREPSLVARARENRLRNGVENVSFHRSDLSEIHPHRDSFRTVCVDPPRTGISRRGRRVIEAMAPERILYLSCNPATFARDCRDFAAAGYRIRDLFMIDMFPGTTHIESLAILCKHA
jgi:23S rRNA (uracil1939-C5)-methyltransferase